MANNKKNVKFWTIPLMLLLCCGMFRSTPANADEKVTCRVFTIEATSDGTGIDDALKPYASIFAQKPFDSFNSFRLADEKMYQLSLNTPTTLQLPGKLKGTLEFKGKSDNRLNLNLNLSKNQSPPIVIEGTTGSGVPFIAAGFKSPKGRWVFAVKCAR